MRSGVLRFIERISCADDLQRTYGIIRRVPQAAMFMVASVFAALGRNSAFISDAGGARCVSTSDTVRPWRLISVFLLTMISAWCAPSTSIAQTQYFYDPASRLSAVLDPVNGTTVYSYDAVGNLLTVATAPASSLAVANVSPMAGPVGTTVTIAGTGFGTTANTSVEFNNVSATPSSVTPTLLVVKVPSGATSGAISVTSPVGTVNTGTIFSVASPAVPRITSVTPSSVSPGDTLTINGGNFDPDLANDKVLINGMYAPTTSVQGRVITANVPNAISGHVTLQTPLGSSTTSSYLTVAPPGYALSSVGSVVTTALNSSAPISVATSGSVGLILFDAAAAQRAIITVPATNAGGQAIVYGPTGSLIAVFSMSAGASSGAMNLPQAGTYEILYEPNAAGANATFAIQQLPPPMTGQIAANGVAVPLSTNSAYQQMQLTFSGTSGQVVSLLVNEPCSSQPLNNAVLCGDNGGTVTRQDLSVGLNGSNNVVYSYNNNYGNLNITGAEQFWTKTFTLPFTGTYTITLMVESPNQGTANFTLSTVPAIVTPIQANGTTVPVTTTAYGQSAVLTFTTTQAENVSLLVNEPCSSQTLTNAVLCGNNGGLATPQDLTITTPNGSGGTTTVYSTTGNFGNLDINGAEQIWTRSQPLLTPGTYTITLTNDWANIGTANFTLSAIPAMVTPIQANGTPVPVTTTAYGQSAVLTFTTTQAQNVSLLVNEPCSSQTLTNAVLCGNNGGLATPQDLTITTPNGSGGTTTVYSTTGNFGNLNINGFEQIWTRSLPLLTAGTYTITLTNDWANIGMANFTLSTVPTIVMPIQANGTPVPVTTTAYGQSAILTFTTTQAENVSLLVNEPCSSQTLTNAVLCGNNGGLATPQDLTITTPNGSGGTTTVYSTTGNFGNMSIPGAEQISTGPQSLPAPGTYTITLTNDWANIGLANFTLSVAQMAVAKIEANGATARSATTAAGQPHLLSFMGTAGEKVGLLVTEPCPAQQLTDLMLCGSNGASTTPQSLTITGPNGPEGPTTVYSTAGNFGDLNIRGAEQIWTGVLSLPADGRYAIALTNDWANIGAANFTLNDASSSPISIKDNGHATSVTTTADASRAVLNFHGTAGQTVALLVSEVCSDIHPAWCRLNGNTPQTLTITTPNSSGGITTVYSVGGDYGNYDTSSDEDLWTGAVTLPTTGIYTITLTDDWASYGTATFYLFNDSPANAVTAGSIGAAPATVATTTPGQSAGITFHGSANERLQITVDPIAETPQGNCRSVSLLANGVAAPVWKGDVCGSNPSTVVPLALPSTPPTGPFTVLVTPGGTTVGSYSVSVGAR